MPATDLAAKRYSQAAFELAQEHRDAPAWQSALERMAGFMSSGEVRHVLENTRVGKEAKLNLIQAGLGDLPPVQLNFAKLLAIKSRTNLAPDIAAQFREKLEAQQGIARAKATTAVSLSDAERQALAQRLEQQTGHSVLLETAVDPSLIGGVVVQIGDRLVDASTRARLSALRERLVSAVH